MPVQINIMIRDCRLKHILDRSCASPLVQVLPERGNEPRTREGTGKTHPVPAEWPLLFIRMPIPIQE
eukprot:199451-Heterocapsa_arctica.AAC.1